MTQIEYLDDLVPGASGPTTVAIGIFDGVHRGHQDILHATARAARASWATAVSLTFDIHPEDILAPERAPGYLTTLEQRAGYIKSFGGGIDRVVSIRFTREFASQSPDEFVAHYLVGVLGAKEVFIGQDFRYGKGRAGNRETLAEEGAELGFRVTVVPPVMQGGERISSTRVRLAVRAGDVVQARELLGHPFEIAGTVGRGKQLGKTLGFPTANLTPGVEGQVLPAGGVYSALARLSDGSVWPAAVSVGTNPTTDADGRQKVEAFLMRGFDGDLYGQTLLLSFGRKVRDQIHFRSVDELVAQMHADVALIDGELGSEAWV